MKPPFLPPSRPAAPSVQEHDPGGLGVQEIGPGGPDHPQDRHDAQRGGVGEEQGPGQGSQYKNPGPVGYNFYSSPSEPGYVQKSP